jgi:sugar-specific transcriptional regulator TrmB
MEKQSRLAEALNKELGLTPYESRAYVSLIFHGPMSPTSLAQKAGIPRPRAYDVLRSLMEKGLLLEQSGKPSVYTAIDPAQGLKNLMVALEMAALRQLEEKRKALQTSIKALSQMYEKSKGLRVERSRVWYTRRDSAFIAIYSEALKSCKKHIHVATTDPEIPEKEILNAVKFALENGTSVKVVRQITGSWTLGDLEKYEAIIQAGSQVRYLDVNEIPLRFTIFDDKDIIIVLPPKSRSRRTQTIEALWLRIPPLAKVLRGHFEGLWAKGEPMLPILAEIRKKKQQE